MNQQIAAIVLTASLLGGCATAPTQQQETAIASGVRVAVVAYVTRGKTAAEQAKRADDVLRMAAVVRSYVTEQGNVLLNLDSAAAVVNQRILSSTLSPGDKQLAQAIVTEAVFLASDQVARMGVNVGAENAAVLLRVIQQIERTAKVFVQS